MLRFLILALVAYETVAKLENDEVLVCSTDPKGRPIQDIQLPPGYDKDYLPVPYGYKKNPIKYVNRPKSSRADILYVVPSPAPIRPAITKSAFYRPIYDEHLAEFIKEQPGQNAPPVHGEYLAEMMYEHSRNAGAAKRTRQLKADKEEKYLDELKYSKLNPEELKKEPCDLKDPFCDKLDLDPKYIEKLGQGYDPKFFTNYEPLKKSKNSQKDQIDFNDLPKNINFDEIYDTRVPKFDFDPLKELKSSDYKGTKFEEMTNSKSFEPVYDSKNSKFQYEPAKELNKNENKDDKYEQAYDTKILEPIREYKAEDIKALKYDPIYETKDSKYAYEELKDSKNDEVKDNKYDQIYDTKNSKFEYEPIRELKNEGINSKYDPTYDTKNSKFEYEPIRELRNEGINSKYDQTYDTKNSKYDYELIRELKNDEKKGSKYDQVYDTKNLKYDYEPVRELKNEETKGNKYDKLYDTKSYEPIREQNLEERKGFKYGSIYDTKNSKHEYEPIREYKNENAKYSKFENYEPINSKFELEENRKFESYEPVRDLKKESIYVRSKLEEKYPTFINRRHEPDSFEEEKISERLQNAPKKLRITKNGPHSSYYMEESKEYRTVTKRPCLPPPCGEEETIESCDCD